MDLGTMIKAVLVGSCVSIGLLIIFCSVALIWIRREKRHIEDDINDRTTPSA